MSALDAYLKRPAKAASRSTSEHSSGDQAAQADVEDLKTDIPYFDDPQQQQQQPPQQQPEADPQQQQQQQQQQQLGGYASAWSPAEEAASPETQLTEDLDLDDSYTDSDYAASGSAANSYYQSPTPSNSDIMLRPPSNTSFQYSYPSSGTGPGPGGGGGGGGGGAGTNNNNNNNSSSSSSSSGRQHAAYGHSQTLALPPPPSPSSSSTNMYPNMWYPNASYGNSGAGHAYGRYAGCGVPPSAAAYAAAVAHGMLPHGHHHPHAPLHHPHPHPLPHPHQHQHPHPHPHALPHPHHQHAHHPHTHDTMMEMFHLSNSGREARNRAEKNRRDKLNGSIQELSTMVAHVAESPRRVDKTAVLRFAAHGLRLKYVFGKTLHQQRPQVTDTLMGMLDSFFLTLTCHGQIVLISSSIEQHLGHCQTDLYGQSILQITHPEDHEMLKQQLIPTELENLFDAHAEPTDADGEPRQRSKSEEDYIDRKLRDDRRSFRVRLARAGPRSEPTAYEVVKIDGCFRRSDEAPRGVRSNTFSSSLQLIRRTRGRDDAIPLHTISGNDIVLTACARIIRPPKIVNRLFDANTLEYRTRHLIDGRIIDCDQRIGIVAGYMTDEVRNLNPFTFMHNDDVRWVIVALRQMYDCNSSYGESTYRLFTRNGNIIYLQSKGYLEIDKETNKVHSFVCVNTLLDDEEGKRRVQEMKKKFSVIINTQIPQSTVDVPASEHPAQLEKAVLCLIQNLQSSQAEQNGEQLDADDDDDDANDDGDEVDEDDGEDGLASLAALSYPDSQQQQQHHHQHRHGHSQHSFHDAGSISQTRLGSGHSVGSSKTPPLALVPPETASVKSSISKSVSVVNVTAAKHLRGLQAATATKSPSSKTGATSTLLDSCTCSCLGEGDCDYCQGPLTPETVISGTSAPLKRSSSGAPNAAGPADALEADIKLAKRRFMPSTEIEHVLSNSLEQIERNLHQQLNVAAQLRDQSNRYELPHANQRIDEILEEHQKQSKLYVNIKSEYEEQLQSKANATKTETDSQGSTSSGIP
ncbi:hypothetical protein AWZ03_011665 [Drosophila navojoa]|uniref:Uncharacterized protein n=1 Tax=Drosophila navojoa TaxID=7232 RepID=A0A484B1G4_DRONA|nr:uncharacterized protein LOC108656933 isoform X2 [Drosophila navojoa]TDG41910.1 hypothetical protein AWZ03_011665 [Drosophila navojoa]